MTTPAENLCTLQWLLDDNRTLRRALAHYALPDSCDWTGRALLAQKVLGLNALDATVITARCHDLICGKVTGTE